MAAMMSSIAFLLRSLQKPHDRVAVAHVFALFPGGGDFQRVALGVSDHEQSSGSQKPRQDDVIEQQLGEGGGSSADILLALGRVGDD